MNIYANVERLCIESESTLGDAIRLMDISRLGIVLVVDQLSKLAGTITDGDIRRAMLSRMDLGESVQRLLERKMNSRFARPISARVGDDPDAYLQLLREHNILHLPVLDDEGRVVGLVRLEDFLPDRDLPVEAVVMAGGRGRRLHPLTEHMPKPMLPVGERPLLELIIEQLRASGVKRVHVTTHHNGDKIVEHFGDGRQFGVELTYVAEHRPLGTAGGLGLINSPDETLLVINGDILTQVNLQAMLDFHREQHADLTLAVRKHDVQVQFGLVECDGVHVRAIREKPVMDFFVNAGIYLIEPNVCRHIQKNESCDMTDLIQRAIDSGEVVVGFPIHEYWLDIGQPPDYEKAQVHAKNQLLR